MDNLQSFARILPYLTHPLSLIGYLLLLVFGIHRSLIKSGIFPQLQASDSSRIIHALLRYGFVVALVVIVLGFALEFIKHLETRSSKVDEEAIVSRLCEHFKPKCTLSQGPEEAQSLIPALLDAVQYLSQRTGIPDIPPHAADALAKLEHGDTKPVEDIFDKIRERNVEKGKQANQKAAQAAWHHGDLVRLHDEEKAYKSYRLAVELVPHSAQSPKRLQDLSPKDPKQAIQDAVMTLKKERDRFSPPSRIDEALSSLERGNTKPVEDIFDELLTNKIAEGKIAYKEAAQAMRHLRTLAILNNPAKELEPKAPRILDFVVNPTDIASGEPSTLSWLTANATVVTLNGTMVALSGEEQVHPVATSTYELIASNQEGKKVSRIVILTIQKPLSNPPRILDFAAIPTDLTPGEPSTLSWLTADATVVTLNGSVVAPSGEKQVHPPTTSAYELIASNREGKWVSSIVILTVRKPPSNPPDAPAEENPRHGGTLRVALAGEPPSLDMHQEQTFIVAIPLSPVYNTLVMFDPHSYPKIIGDLAQSWTVSEDRMTWIFTLHQGVKFHDGSDLTSADVKASWDKIVFPPQGLVSPRKSEYDTIKSIEAPDPYTVVFHLHYASTSFLSGLAHPANFIYAKKYLDQDPNWYKRHTMGTGPFKLKGYVRGSTLELERNPNYWKQGLPYLDGIKYFIILGDNERAHSILSDHTDIEFRGLNPTFIGVMKNKMGNRLTVAYPGTPVHWGVAINIDKKPFDDERVRKALSLAINRYEMATIIGPLTSMDTLGGPQPPDTLGALTEEELQQLPGFRKDYESSLAEAKQLLQEAGYPNGFKTVLTNRDIKLPYFDFGIYLISSWKKIEVEVEHKIEGTAAWTKSRQTQNFELLVDPFGYTAAGDPNEVMSKFLSDSPENWGRFKDPMVDDLFEQQKVEKDQPYRAELVKAMQKRIIEKNWELFGLWWTRIEVRSSNIHNYTPYPSPWLNRRLEDIWLAER